MNTTLNHLKKNESLSNKQLVVVNSDFRTSETQNTSSFTYEFKSPIERVSKIDIISCTLNKSYDNVNNTNAVLSITTKTFTETSNVELAIDDVEIQSGVIQPSNNIDGSVQQRNLFKCSDDVEVDDVYVKNTNIYATGCFNSDVLDFCNANDTSAGAFLTNVGSNDIYWTKYTLDQLFILRCRIAGSASDISSQIIATDDNVIITAKFNSSPLVFYDSNDVSAGNDLTPIGGVNNSVICNYTNLGVLNWRLRISNTSSSNSLKIVVDDNNEYFYVADSNNTSPSFYDKTDSLVDTLTVTGTTTFVARYTIDGVLQWRAKIQGENAGAINLHDLTINPETGNIMLGISFEDVVNIYNSSDVTNPANNLTISGVESLSVVEYDITGEFVNRIKIGGSSSDVSIKIASTSNKLVILGTYISNPLKFYNSDDTQTESITNTTGTTNLFLSAYSIDNTLMTKSNEWNIKLETRLSTLSNIDININLNSEIICSGTYVSLLSFNDVNGIVLNQDLSNDNETASMFVAKYDIDGNFIYRNNVSSTTLGDVYPTRIFAGANNLYISGNFTSDVISFYNPDNTLDSTLTNQGTTNGFIMSLVDNVNNLSIDDTTLLKRVLCRNRIGDDLNYILELNAFSQSLGFSVSQKFISSVFGSSISWTELNVTDLNNTITIVFNIADEDTLMFVDVTKTFTITNTDYTPYSIAYQLSTVISTDLMNDTSFNYSNTVSPVTYDNTKNIFYFRFDIDGTFQLSPTTLINSDNLNCPTTVSPVCVISNQRIDEVGDITTTDNSKISIQLTENDSSEKINRATFSSAFPSITSGTLTISSALDSQIFAVASDSSDLINSDIDDKDIITALAPFVVKYTDLTPVTDFAYADIAMNLDATIRAVVGTNMQIFVSTDSGTTWVPHGFEDTYTTVSMSNTGEIMIAATDQRLYVSVDFGVTWTPRDSSRRWEGSSVSGDGTILAAVATDVYGYILISTDSGVSWNIPNDSPGLNSWKGIKLSVDGRYQTVVGTGTEIYVSSDYGVSWALPSIQPAGALSWTDVSMSSDGSVQVACAISGEIYYSSDNGETWTAATVPGGQSWVCIDVSSDGVDQIAGTDGGSIYKSSDSGANWAIVTTPPPNGRVFGIAVSGDGITQTACIRFYAIYDSADTGDTWASVSSPERPTTGSWNDISISYDGQYQTAANGNQSMYRSIDFGETWSAIGTLPAGTYNTVVSSSTGELQMTAANNGNIYKSINFGVDWAELVTQPMSPQPWTKMGVSQNNSDPLLDGKYQTAVVSGGLIYRSEDFGDTWAAATTQPAAKLWTDVSVSGTGQYQTACALFERLYISDDYGETWVENTDTELEQYFAISVSLTGQYQVASVNGPGYNVYTSNDFGITWTIKTVLDSGLPGGCSMSYDGKYQIVGMSPLLYSVDYGENWDGLIWSQTLAAPRSVAISGDGEYQTIGIARSYIFVHSFIFDRRFTFTNQVISDTGTEQAIYFIETADEDYSLFDGLDFNIFNEFTITSNTSAELTDLFVPSGTYTPSTLMSTINNLITDVNPNFTNAFSYDEITRKTTFTPFISGINVLAITNLLNKMGFNILPETFTSGVPVVSTSQVSANLSGPNNVYIKSFALSALRKLKNPAPVGYNIADVIAPLVQTSIPTELGIITPVEIFLNKKATISIFDIQIVDDAGQIVNLNNGVVQLHMYFYTS